MISKAVFTGRGATRALPWGHQPSGRTKPTSMIADGHPGAKTRTPADYRVEVVRDWAAFAPVWSAMGTEAATGPFQHRFWLDAWYGAFASAQEIEPRIIVARDRADGRLAVALPLIVRSRRGLRIAQFADCDLTDYNAPLLGPAAPDDEVGAERLWRALVAAGLDDVDFVELKKMPVALGGRPNPLALLPYVARCAVDGNIVTTGDDYDAWRHSRGRSARKDLERCWRVFMRHENAAFRRITDVDEALDTLAVMERQQSSRMTELGQVYILDRSGPRTFYRELIASGLGSGDVVMTALACNGDVIAALLGIRDAARFVMIRISHAGAAWSNCSPGRLVIERSMAHLHGLGCREFDFGIGDYDYKRRFGVDTIPLVDNVTALNWRALPSATRSGAVQWLRRHPELDRLARRWFAGRRAAARRSPEGAVAPPSVGAMNGRPTPARLLASSETPPALC